MHLVSCCLRVDDQAANRVRQEIPFRHTASSLLGPNFANDSCRWIETPPVAVRSGLPGCVSASNLLPPVRIYKTPGSDWITRIADGQTITYSVSADEVSMSLLVQAHGRGSTDIPTER